MYGYFVSARSKTLSCIRHFNCYFTDNMYVLHTLSEYGYQYGFTTIPSYWFEFEIKGSQDACIMVSSNTDFNDDSNGRSVEVSVKGLVTLEAFSCFYLQTDLSSNVFLIGN